MTHNEGVGSSIENGAISVKYGCRYPANYSRSCPACCFKRLATEYWNINSTDAALDQRVLRLHNSLFSLSLVTPTYLIRGTQERPGEIMQHIQRALEESTSTNTNSWRREASAMFMINIFSELECTQCGHESIVLNAPENLLPLIIEGRANVTDGLHASLRRYFTGEITKTCERCSLSDRIADNTNHISLRKIDAGPQVLTIQLMLFWTNYDKDTKEYTEGNKINEVFYPMDLDLSPYQPGDVAQTIDDATFTHKTDPTTNEHTFVPNTLLKYKLKAVIVHWGSTIDGGHYIATCGIPTRS
jgi:uncharacterized UBP type Zn finger protein